MNEVIRSVLWSKNRIKLKFPYKMKINPYSFGTGEYNDFLSFGFAYVEYKDHFVDCILSHPLTMRSIIRNTDVRLSVGKDYIGKLWATKLYVTDKVKEKSIIFSSENNSMVLDLDLNKMEINNADL